MSLDENASMTPEVAGYSLDSKAPAAQVEPQPNIASATQFAAESPAPAPQPVAEPSVQRASEPILDASSPLQPTPQPNAGPSAQQMPASQPAAEPAPYTASAPKPEAAPRFASESPAPQSTANPAAPQPQAPQPASKSAPDAGDTAARPGATAPKPTITSTIRLPHPEPATEAANDPKLRDVNRDLLRWLRNRMGTIGAYLSAHSRLVALIALALVAFVLGVVLFGMNAAQVPSDSQIATDARNMLGAPTYTAGDYAESEPLTLNLVEVASKQRNGTRSDACDVYVTATFSNDHIESQANATLTYVREGDRWNCTAAATANASHRAIAGVDEPLVLAAVDTLLQEANDPDDGRPSLSSLYHDADIKVVDDEISEDGQSENLTLHCKSTGTFVCYECDLTAHFKFAAASGAWELASVQASSGAKDLGFSPLVGTWTGTFRSQETDQGKCLAARESGLTITITSASPNEDGGATIQGSLSGVAHLHMVLEEDADKTDGDLQLDAVPFTGMLQTDDADSEGGITFVCATQDTVGGSVSLLLSFGSSKAPDSVTATLVSKHSYQDTFLWLVPYEREARFADTFTLEKAAD